MDWIFDELYEKGLKGPNKSAHHDWFELDTTQNMNLDQEAVALQMSVWSQQMINVRIKGQPMRFSNRIHPLFTDTEQTWCYRCHTPVQAEKGQCSGCQGFDITTYCHVAEIEPSPIWPTVFLLDPHPRKPHMFMWAQIDPGDDVWVVAEAEVDGDEVEVKQTVDEIEESLGLYVPMRIIDPNMGRSPANTSRELTWQDAFDRAGLRCDLADDSSVGRKTLNVYLKPDEHTLRPRVHIATSCPNTAYQMKRYVWSEFKRSMEKDVKQTPREKYDDYPTLLKYLMNAGPTFNMLKSGPSTLSRPGTRRGAY